MTDVVGLYMNPPDRALVLCVDEKSQIQALDRTQPGLPLKKGRAATMTHDYKRHGTTTLYAALDVRDRPRHRRLQAATPRAEFIALPEADRRDRDKHLDLHLVVDNYGTHKTAEVKAWLAKHPRFHLHFTPTSASWLNLVERFFAEITRKRIRRGAFASVAELEAGDPRLSREPQRQSQAVRVDQDGGDHPGKGSGVPSTHSKPSKLGINRQSRNTRGVPQSIYCRGVWNSSSVFRGESHTDANEWQWNIDPGLFVVDICDRRFNSRAEG